MNKLKLPVMQVILCLQVKDIFPRPGNSRKLRASIKSDLLQGL